MLKTSGTYIVIQFSKNMTVFLENLRFIMALKSPENTVILSKQKINTLPYKLDFE